MPILNALNARFNFTMDELDEINDLNQQLLFQV
jgi:hypothetical protein